MTTATLANLPSVYTELPAAERYSDAGDAVLLEALSGDYLRHVTAWGWLAYHAGTWDNEDGQKLVERRVEEALRPVAQAAADAVGSKQGDALYSHAKQAFNRVGYIAQAASRREKLSARTDQFDANPNLLNAANGVIDLTDGSIHPHSPTFYLTKQTGAMYIAKPAKVAAAAAGDAEAVAHINAGCPEFLTFLDGVFCGDTDLVSYMQKALGYTLTASTQEHGLFILYGGGRNGKSSLLNTLAGVLGEYATTVKPETLVHQGISYRGENSADPELARLPGVRLVTSVEPSNADGKGKLDEARVKQLTGGDPLSVRKLYHEGFTYTPVFKLFLATNELPKVEKSDEGIWRRLKPIPFDARFEPSTPGYVADIHKVLLEKEKDGILAWLVVGALRFRKEGLGDPPKRMQALMDKYHREQQPYSGFFADVVARDPEAVTPLTDAYDRFKAWCREHAEDLRDALGLPETRNGYPVALDLPGKQAFGAMCEAQNFTKGKRKTGFVWRGMRLRTPDELRDSPEDASPEGDGCNGCSFDPLFTEVSIERSYKHFSETGVETAPTAPPDNPVAHREPDDRPSEPDTPVAEVASEPDGPLASSEPDGPKIVPVLEWGRRSVIMQYGQAAIGGVPLSTEGCCHPRAEHLCDEGGEAYLECPDCRSGYGYERSFYCGDVTGHRARWDALGCPLCDAAFAVRYWDGRSWEAEEAERQRREAEWKAKQATEEAEQRRKWEAEQAQKAAEQAQHEAEVARWEAKLDELGLSDTARWLVTGTRDVCLLSRDAWVFYATHDSPYREHDPFLGPKRPAADVLEALDRMTQQGVLVITERHGRPVYELSDDMKVAAGSLLRPRGSAAKAASAPNATPPKNPASDKQKALLTKLGYTGNLEMLDVGGASHAIDWLLHGKAQFDEQMAEAEAEAAWRLQHDDEDEDVAFANFD